MWNLNWHSTTSRAVRFSNEPGNSELPSTTEVTSRFGIGTWTFSWQTLNLLDHLRSVHCVLQPFSRSREGIKASHRITSITSDLIRSCYGNYFAKSTTESLNRNYSIFGTTVLTEMCITSCWPLWSKVNPEAQNSHARFGFTEGDWQIYGRKTTVNSNLATGRVMSEN